MTRPRDRRRAGLSLLEALASTALLAFVVAACLPLLQLAAAGSAAGSGTDSGSGAGIGTDAAVRSALSDLADGVAAAPESFGVTPELLRRIPVRWPAHIEADATRFGLRLPEASVEPLASSTGRISDPSRDPSGGGVELAEQWIVLRAGDAVAHRWVRIRPIGRSPRSRGQGRRRATPSRLRRRRRRGLTLVETLLALGIVSAMATAAFSFAAVAARIAATTAASSEIRSATSAVFRLLADDLGSFDRDGRRASRRQSEGPGGRVRVEEGALVLQTRSCLPGATGPTERRYLLDAAERVLWAVDMEEGRETRRTLLARGVDRWAPILVVKGSSSAQGAAAIGRRPDAAAGVELVATIGFVGGESATRRYPVR